MPLLPADTPIGRPTFDLGEDERATVIDLLCEGAKCAALLAKPGMLEVPLTRLVRKCMRRVKMERGIGGIRIGGERELDDMATDDPNILGRIDLVLEFLHQFDDEDAFVAVEAKRVGAGKPTLNQRYVTEGVARFAKGQYSSGHPWAFMLAYVLATPVQHSINGINRHLARGYGKDACMVPIKTHPESMSLQQSRVFQAVIPSHELKLVHVLVDMSSAAAKPE